MHNSDWRWSPDSAPHGPLNGAKRLDSNSKTAGNLNFAWAETVLSTFELTLVAEVFDGWVLTYGILDGVRYPASPDKIVLGLPWYAYDFACAVGTAPTERFCNATDDFEGHFSCKNTSPSHCCNRV
jgi:hypothetical protein